MCKDAPDPDPLIGEAAKLNAELGKEALTFYKDVYERDVAPATKRDQDLRQRLVDSTTATLDRQRQIGDEQYDYYKEVYQPLERKVAQEAQDYDSAENVNRRMGIASANVNQQFSNAGQQRARMLTRYGLNPNSSAFSRDTANMANQQALASAGAQTGAAFDTMDRGIALRAAAANKPVIASALNAYGGANSAANNAGGISAQGMGVMSQGAGVMGQGYNTGMQGYNNAGNLMLGDFNARMRGYEAEQAAIGGLFQGLGTFAGLKWADGGLISKYADGGEVDGGSMDAHTLAAAQVDHALGLKAGGAVARPPRVRPGSTTRRGGKVAGPGGPKDDRVPALLSDGEFVMPVGTVKKYGLDKLEKMRQDGLQFEKQLGIGRS